MSPLLSHFFMMLIGALIGVFIARCMYAAPVIPEQAPAQEEQPRPSLTWTSRDLRKRKGVVAVNRDVILDRAVSGDCEEFRAAYAAMMRDFIIYNAISSGWGEVEYSGYHPDFDEVEEGFYPPRYIANISKASHEGPGGQPIEVYNVKFVRTS